MDRNELVRLAHELQVALFRSEINETDAEALAVSINELLRQVRNDEHI